MKAAQLGELEQQVMDIVWEKKQCSVRDVQKNLQPNKKLAYTTVATILQRLYEKSLVVRKESKNGYVYSSKMSKVKYSQNVAKTFINNFINSFGDTAIASFAQGIEKLPIKKRDYFLKVLKEYEGNNK